MRRLNLIKILLGLVLFGGATSIGLAESVEAITNRIEARLSAIDSLKVEGKVGETFDGYLSPRDSLSGRESSLVNAENSDRRSLYAVVAEKTGQSISEVGKQRALRIAQQSRSGIWLQDRSGEWLKKP